MRTFKRLLATALLLTPLYAQALEPINSVAAVVNDGIVMASEVDRRVAQITQQLQARQANMPPADVLRSQVLEQLIIESLQQQVAKKQGIRVSDQELNQAMQRVAQQNNLSLPQFREAVIAQGGSYPEVRDQIRRELLLQKVQESNVNRRINVTDLEVQNYLNSELAKGNDNTELLLSNILVALPSPASPQQIQAAQAKAQALVEQLKQGANFADLAVSVSDAPNALSGGDLGWRKLAELPTNIAMAANKLENGEYSQPIRTPSGFNILSLRERRGSQQALVEQSRTRHILVRPTEIRTQEQAKAFADELYARLNEGEPFDELARRYSDDPASGSLGGELGWVQPGQMVPEFEQKMNSLAVGQVSTPFESRFGWHIVEVTERRTEDFTSEMRENAARIEIRKRKSSEELQNWLRELRSEAYVDIKAR